MHSVQYMPHDQCVLQKMAPLCGPMEKLHFPDQGSKNIYTGSALWNAKCCSVCVDTLATIAKFLQLLLHHFPCLHPCHIFHQHVYLIESDQWSQTEIDFTVLDESQSKTKWPMAYAAYSTSTSKSVFDHFISFWAAVANKKILGSGSAKTPACDPSHTWEMT